MDTPQANGDEKRLKVAVVGGGMCGFVTAVGLTRAGVDVAIYEAAAKLGEIGAGVGLGPNAVRVLRELNILDEVEVAVYPEKPAPREFRFLFGTGDHEVIYDYPVGSNDSGLGVHRAVFLDAIVHLMDASKIHCNKRCIAIRTTPSHRTQVLFKDGTSAEADVVIGADGVRSVVRNYVVEGGEIDGRGPEERSIEENGSATEVMTSPKVVRAKFTNHSAYRGLVSVEQLKEAGVKLDLSERLHCFIGECRHVLTFPIKDRKVVNVVAFNYDSSVQWGEKPIPPGTPWVTSASKDELLEVYQGWCEDVRLLLGCIERPSVWSIHAIDPPLENYVRGRVALVGDSAHAMLPYLGAGAGQALEDALAMVKLLAHPQTRVDNIEEVLKAYDAVRRPHANEILARSTLMGLVYDSLGPSGVTKEGIRKDLEGKWDDIWRRDVLQDVDAAIDQLVEAGAFVN